MNRFHLEDRAVGREGLLFKGWSTEYVPHLTHANLAKETNYIQLIGYASILAEAKH